MGLGEGSTGRTDGGCASASVERRGILGMSEKTVASVTVAAVVMLALALRLYQLGSESLWGDEGCSLSDAASWYLRGPRPLYYLLLREWIELGAGGSEFLLRIPALAFGVGGVWVLYALGRRLFGHPAALLASVFMAISVLHVNHSQEVRMYSLTTLGPLLAAYFLMLALDRGRTRYLLAYVGFAFVSLLTFPLTALVLGAHGLFLLLYARAYRPVSLVLLGGQLAFLAAWLPWLSRNVHVSASFGEGYIAMLDKPSLPDIVALSGQFFLWKWSDPGPILTAGAFGFSFMVLAVALYGLKGVRRTDASPAFVWLWLIVPVAGMVMLSYSVANMWMVRYLIAASPAFYLLVSKGICSLRNRYVAGAVVLVVMALTLGRLGLYYARPVRPEWRPAVAYVHTHERPGDVIGIYSAGNQFVFRYYYRGRAQWAPLGADLSREQQFGEWSDAEVREALADFPFTGQRFWMIFSKHTFRGGFNIIGYLTRRYRVLDHRSYNKLELYLFDAGGQPVPGESLRREG